MKPFPFILLATLSMLLSCNDSDRSTNSAPENDINTATEFLRSALDGNYDKARTLMVDDSINRQDMDVSERLLLPPTPEQVLSWQCLMKRTLDSVRVVPQTHKMIGQL